MRSYAWSIKYRAYVAPPIDESARGRAWCTSFQRSCNAPLVVSGGDQRQGERNGPHKSSMEVHSSRVGSRPAAKRYDGRAHTTPSTGRGLLLDFRRETEQQDR